MRKEEMNMRKTLSLLLAAALTLSLAACGSGNPPPSSQDGQVSGSAASQAGSSAASTTPGGAASDPSVLYTNGGPEEFFEAPWLNPGTFFYNRVLYDRLLVADENLQPKEGQMAQSYQLSPDGKTLEFVLRDGIKWHDGEAVTGDDIKWSVEYALKVPSLNAVFSATFKSLDGVQAYMDGTADNVSGIVVDGNKITMTFSKAAPDALLTFTQFAPLPKKHLKDADPNTFQQASFFQNPIGSGPFKVKEVQMKNYTILEPNADYWNGVPAYSVHLNPSAGDSDANLVTNAKAGQLDYAYTKNIADIKALEGTPGLNIQQVDVRYTRLLYINKFPKADGKPSPLSDKRVRQAIRYSIDLPAILDGIFEGAAVPANSLTPDGSDKTDGLNNYEYDVEKAKALLKEANWDPNTTLDCVYYYTDQQTIDLMTIIQSYLQQAGIKMNFRLVEGDLSTLLWKAPSDPANGPSAVDWDMCYAAVGALSLHEYYDRYQTGNPLNSHTPSDPALDQLITATNASIDPQAQKNAFFELQKYENENLFSVALYYQPVFVITSSKIKQGAPAIGNPQFNYSWDIQNWKLG